MRRYHQALSPQQECDAVIKRLVGRTCTNFNYNIWAGKCIASSRVRTERCILSDLYELFFVLHAWYYVEKQEYIAASPVNVVCITVVDATGTVWELVKRVLDIETPWTIILEPIDGSR
jgi:hypothetical protein